MTVDHRELRTIRNNIPIQSLFSPLAIPTKQRDHILRFLCPLCSDFNTAINPKTNLARCFRCKKNFNTIDLVMVTRKCGFKEAVAFLKSDFRGISHPATANATGAPFHIKEIFLASLSQTPIASHAELNQDRLSAIEQRLAAIETQVAKISRFLSSGSR